MNKLSQDYAEELIIYKDELKAFSKYVNRDTYNINVIKTMLNELLNYTEALIKEKNHE